MKLDSLSEKTGEIVREREKLREETEQFSDEAEKVRTVREQSGDLDSDIQDAISELEEAFGSEEDSLRLREDEIQAGKDELAGNIQEELSKLQETLGVLDAVSGKTYAGGIGQASQTCREYRDQLEALLRQLGDEPSGGAGMSARPGGGGPGGTCGGVWSESQALLMSRYPAIQGAHSIEDDLTATNPNFSDDYDSPWNINCQRCVSAYEARRRGYDVEAQPVPEDRANDVLPIMMHPQGWPSVYAGAKLVDCSAHSGSAARDRVERQLAAWGDDVRAIVRVRWKIGGGHVFIAERIGGVTRFVDPQNGSADASGYFDFTQGNELFCMRIDNLDFTSRIHQCCQIRKK